MQLRRVVIAALAVVALCPIAPAIADFRPSASTPEIKRLPRPERSHDAKGPKGPKGTKDPRDPKDRGHDLHAVLVRFERGASAAAKARALKGSGATLAEAVAGTGFVRARTAGGAAGALRRLMRDPSVDTVSLDYRRELAAAPNDPIYTGGDQPYLGTVRLPQAWDLVKDAHTQVIAVVDTGVDTAHPDLVGRTVPGYNVITPGAAPTDQIGHGTMVAGVAAANTNNGVGVAGTAWNGRIMPVKVFRPDRTALDSDVAEGIAWAVDHGAKIVNLSLGGPVDDPVLRQAVQYATSKGALVVVAAGNGGDSAPQYPAAYPEVVAVGATDSSGALTDFSSWGDWLDVAAPGFGIVSTFPTASGYAYAIASGTSFSAPIVSGVAALVRAKYPTLTPAQVISRLRATTRDAGPRGIDPYYGHGVLDAFYAAGGTWGAEFPQRALGASEPNDTPARAAAAPSGFASGTVAMEGDVDWYRYEANAHQAVSVTVTPPAYDATRAQNFDPVLEVYDAQLRLLGQADSQDPTAQESLAFNLQAGTYYVAVRNFNGAADTRPYTVVIEGFPVPLFQPAQSTRVGSWPETVAIGDVTGDGRGDVLLATSYYSDPLNDFKLFVFAQNADGSLAAPVRYGTRLEDSSRASFALVDIDVDGRLDVALATPPGVEIFRQTEAGALENQGVLPDTAGADQLVAADMDADGDTDLVMTSQAGIALLTHEPGGAFVPSAVTTDGTKEVEAGDVDGDGRADVVGFQGAVVHVYHRTDTGWNRTDHDTDGSYSPTINGIEVADVSGDGRADVVATLKGNTAPGNQINVFTQTAAGGLSAPAVYFTWGGVPEPVAAADINGDARLDVVTAQGEWNMLSVLLQTPDGKLASQVTSSITYASHYNVQGLALGDINGDGRNDAVTADYANGLVVFGNAAGTPLLGEQRWVRDVAPADFTTGAAVDTAPRVSFQRALDPASVDSTTVRLVHGRTGATVPATPSYDELTKTVTLAPAAPLQDNTPYRIVVGAVRDQAGATNAAPFSTTFRTVDLAPPPVGSFQATGAYRAATLAWTLPNITDLDQVIVRMAAGATPPSSPTTGTGVYAGTGTGVRVTGLASGTNYSFRMWVRDRPGKLSTAPSARLVGTALAVSTSATAVTYGGIVTITGRLVRPDTGTVVSGVPVQLYGRRKSTTTWPLVGTVTSGSTGYLSFRHVPSWSLDYQWRYNGSTAYMGAVSATRLVQVRPVVTATLSTSSFPLGGSVTLSGSVRPNHAGQAVYLQRLVNGSWANVTSRALSSTSGYAFTIKPSTRGTFSYRVYKPADTDHLAAASATRSFTVT
jgi:type VII secretion-associated serine protease mycosin